MRGLRRFALGALGTLLILACSDSEPLAPSIQALIDCGAGTGGDLIERGFYVPSFPGTRLDRVTYTCRPGPRARTRSS